MTQPSDASALANKPLDPPAEAAAGQRQRSARSEDSREIESGHRRRHS